MSNCNFRCPFCHNKELVFGKNNAQLTEEKALEMLASRRGFIDGVVVTGGEPTIYPGLDELIFKIKKLGFRVKLDTNGYKPRMLRSLFTAKSVDFVAMDIKTSWEKYNRATGIEVNIKCLVESIDLIKYSGIEYEFRTTCVPSLVDGEDVEEISKLAGRSGLFTLQQFQPENTLDPDYSSVIPYSRDKLLDFLEVARRNTNSCRLIGL
jgi:pyruvate formate lyase activating enzyme